MVLDPDFRDLLEEFARARVELVIVGAYAVAFYGRARATKDIDIVLERSPENLARAAEALAQFGAPANVVDAVRSMQPSDVVYMGQAPLRVDFLIEIDGVKSTELFARAADGKLDGVPVRVIGLDDLIANKRAAGRPQDRIDADYLEKVRRKKKGP
jgi:predicted nucleotidyltransferase